MCLVQSSPPARTARFLKKRFPPCYYVRGVLCSPLAPNASARTLFCLHVHFSFFLFGSSVALCAAAGCGGSLRSNQSPPLPPLRGGLRGLPKEVKDGEAYPTHTATTLYRQKRKKPNIYTIYRGLSPPYVQSIAQKKPYMSRASTAWGLSPPLDIGFFCALALIRGKSPSLSIVCSYFSGCDILTSV